MTASNPTKCTPLPGSGPGGLQLSYSCSTRALLADKATAFARDVRAALLRAPCGLVTEPFRVEVLIAARP